ncbi:MAG: DNA-binding protein [Burkholderiales bacterium]
MNALEVQRAADMLMRRGQKPSIASGLEELGGGSPHMLAPLLDKYWKGLGNRLPAGPKSLGVPESLARMTEALWLRSLDEARERTKASLIGASLSQREPATLQRKVTELTAALAESRASSSELEVQLLTSPRERLQLREQLQQMTTLLKPEQELCVLERLTGEARRREAETSRDEVLTIARRRLATRGYGRRVTRPAKRAQETNCDKRSADRRHDKAAGRHKQVLPVAFRGPRRQSDRRRTAPTRIRT